MFHPEGPTLLELAEQAMTSVERGYDLLARKFDRTPFRTPDAILDRVFADRFEAGSVGSAADLCCGTGAALARLRPLARDRVIGVDLSAGMLARAQEAAERAPGASRVALFHQDVLRYDPAWGQVELATCFGAFGHILPRDEPRLIETIRALLVPGGRFVFVTAEGPPSPREAAFWLAHGFNAVMRARNAVWSPPFVMYYLTFLLPRARALLEARGFELEVVRGLFDQDNARYVLVVATRT